MFIYYYLILLLTFSSSSILPYIFKSIFNMKAYSNRDVRARKTLQSLGVDPDRNPGVRIYAHTYVHVLCTCTLTYHIQTFFFEV